MSRAMPDLSGATRGVRHTLDSALPTLLRLGVSLDEIVVESAGLGWPEGTVVRQRPEPGTPLGERVRVVLGVAGEGALDALPYPLRDTDETPYGVDPLFALFDSPLHKLVHHLREAGGYWALRADDPRSARRWVEGVFQVDLTPWPERRWYAIARLLPMLHRVGGTERGLRLALELVFGLPVESVGWTRDEVPFKDGRLRLAGTGSRLGVDTVLGGGLVEQAGAEIHLGPMTLDLYRAHQSPELRRQRDALYRLVLPSRLGGAARERWVVGDRTAAFPLGDLFTEVALGVNSFLGRGAQRRVA